MANGKSMNKALSDAKAVLDTYGFEMHPTVKKALAAMIEEIERLTAPLDADDGRELVERLKGRVWTQHYADHEAVEVADVDAIRAADLIERQAARIAAQDGELAKWEKLGSDEYRLAVAEIERLRTLLVAAGVAHV